MITLADIQGHWVRDWIKAPGFEDHTTRVHWMQVGATYADMRVPLERPDIDNAGSLSDLPAEALAKLAEAEGFAGTISLEGTQCTWHREINWHGATDVVDIGAISFDQQGRMIETGVHSEYTELWQAQPGRDQQAIRLEGTEYVGYLAVRKGAFVLGIGKPEKPSTEPMIAALKSGQVPDDIAQLFDGIHAYGHVSGGKFICTLATQPFAEQKEIARQFDSTLRWHRIGFDGSTKQIDLISIS